VQAPLRPALLAAWPHAWSVSGTGCPMVGRGL